MTPQTISQRIPKRPPAGWQTEAACRDLPITPDYDPFFMTDEERFTNNKWDEAKQMCGTCPVKRACLQDAIALETTDTLPIMGYRAGMSAKARKALIRKLKEPQ